jgi:hypothetical protein
VVKTPGAAIKSGGIGIGVARFFLYRPKQNANGDNYVGAHYFEG